MGEYRVGDEAIMEAAGLYKPVRIVRITPTGRVVVRAGTAEWTFAKDGFELGAKGRPAFLRPMTDEAREDIERRELALALNGIKWSTQPIEKLRQVLAILEQN